MRTAIVIACWMLLSACSTQFAPRAWMNNVTPTGIAETRLRKFGSEAEFQAYLLRVRADAEERGLWWAQANRFSRFHAVASTANDSTEPLPCDPDDPECGRLEEVVVTASKMSSSSDSSVPMSITNNQEIGVDEGDIIKLVGRFLIVLQDGRLFSIDTGHQSGSLRLVDRIDLYFEDRDDVWYDELLVSGNRLVVIGFNWHDESSEITVLDMDTNGVITHEATYYVESNDYYSEENYASRMIGDELVFYSPYGLIETDFDEPMVYPRIRRWTQTEGFSEWRNLFGATDLYRPVQGTLTPTIHAVTRCSIAEFSCRSSGILDAEQVEFYVSPSYFYLWAPADLEIYWENEIRACTANDVIAELAAWPAMLYRVPHSMEATQATQVAGIPPNQFAMEERDNRFYSLVSWLPTTCEDDSPEMTPHKFVSIDSSSFSRTPARTNSTSYTTVPTVPGDYVETRFARDHLLYTGIESYWHHFYWNRPAELETTTLTAIPLTNPEQSAQLSLTHTGNRLELLGEYAVINGYSSLEALDFSLIGLGENPTVLDTVSIPWVRESEGRSHAFNGLLDSDGSGIFAVPTIDQLRFKELREQKVWPELPSDLTFLSINSDQQLSGAGHLFATDEPADNGYQCEVSCEDWYGNARAVFIGDRVFTISGDELIEGELIQGKMSEIYRIRITEDPQNSR